jgi:mono/diheme cytochrome c family protein
MKTIIVRLLPVVVSLAMPALAAEVPAAFNYQPQKVSPADRPTVEALYVNTCAACHGMKGEGNGNGLALYGSKDPLASAGAMHFGRKQPPPLEIVMPAYGVQSLLTQAQIGQLAEYISGFHPPWP